MKRVLEIMPLGSSAISFIGDQLSFLKKHGAYEMHLICSPGNGHILYDFIEREGAVYYPLSIPRAIKPWQDIKNIWKIFRYMRKNNFDVVIGHQSKGVLYGMLAGRLAGIKYRIILAHGILEDTMMGMKQKLFVVENKLVTSCSTHVLCVSPSVMKRRIALGIDVPQKQFILGKGTCNGVDTVNKFNPQLVSAYVRDDISAKYGLTNGDFVVGFCGRLVKDKGVTELSEAIKLLHEKYPEKQIKLFVIGALEKRDAIPDNIVHFLRDSSQVVFTGVVPYSEIQNYYTVMDVFVLPSYREGFPTVVLEASAMGLPIIVSRSTGCIDSIIEGVTGLYCDINASSIASAITTFFDKEIANQYGAAARKFVVENFEHTIVRQQMLNFLNKVISDK